MHTVPILHKYYREINIQAASWTEDCLLEDMVDSGSGNPLKLGIHGQAQFWNASLALNLAQAWIERRRKREDDTGVLSTSDVNANTLPFSLGHEIKARKSGDSESSTTTCGSVTIPFSFDDESFAPLPPATPFPLLPPHLAGLRRTKWPGRSQVVKVHAGITISI